MKAIASAGGVRRRIVAKARLRRKSVAWLGVVLIAAGAGVVMLPNVALPVVGAVAGWLLWFVGAAMLLVSGLVATGRSLWAGMLTSCVAVAGGAFLFFNPDAGVLAATLLIAAVLVLDGASELTLALELRPMGVWRLVLASSIASGLAGLIIGAGAERARDLTALFLGLALASTGAALLALGGRDRAARPHSAGGSRSPRTPST